MKSAALYILDCHASMNESTGDSGSTSCLELSKQTIQRMLHEKLLAGRKTEFVGAVLFGTETTDNHLSNDGEFQNVRTIFEPAPATLDLLKRIGTVEATAVSDDKGDPLDALIIAVDMALALKKKAPWDIKVYMFTSGKCRVSENGLDEIAERLKSEHVSVNVVMNEPPEGQEAQEGYADYAFFQKLTSEKLEGTQSDVFSFEDAIDSALNPHKKVVSQVNLFKGTLDFGEHLKIPISVFSKCSEFKPPSLKKVVDSVETGSAVKVAREKGFKVTGDDEGDEGEPQSVEKLDKDQLVKLAKYGSTQVTINAFDEKLFDDFVKGKQMAIIGFVSIADIRRHWFMSSVWFVQAQVTEGPNAVIFGSLVNAMLDMNVAAIVRFARTASSNPKIAALLPMQKEHKYQGLYFTHIPYMDDLREFHFRPLPTDFVSNENDEPIAVEKKGAFAPSDAQLKAAGDLIQALNLEQEEDNSCDVKEIYHPAYHRLSQCVLHRILHPNDPLPPVDERLVDRLKRDETLFAGSHVEEFNKQFSIKVKPPKIPQKKRKAHILDNTVEKAYEDLFAGSQTSASGTKEFDLDDALLRFKERIEEPGDQVTEAVDEFTAELEKFLSFHPSRPVSAELASKCLSCLRGVCSREDESDRYNKFMYKLKTMYSEGALLMQIWTRFKQRQLGLITRYEAEDSLVKEEEADRFFEE